MAIDLRHIIEEIRGLAPAERGRLLRWLQASGLLVPAELATDRRRLRVAPAVHQKDGPVSREDASPVTGAVAGSSQEEPVAEDGYRSPVRGRVVVGAPRRQEGPPAEMQPLPGQAPEKPIRIIFDGGSRGNPGQGYGSYALNWPGFAPQVVRLQFGDRVTNNEAEYDTLIAAIEAVLKRLTENDADPASARLEIRGDSQLVVNQVNGQWQCNEGRLRVRRDRALGLLRRFGTWQLRYHPREKSVEVLGH